MLAVDVLVRVPLSGEEGMLLADDLSIEECGQLEKQICMHFNISWRDSLILLKNSPWDTLPSDP